MDLLGTNFSTDHIQGSNEVNAGIDIDAEFALEDNKDFDSNQGRLGPALFFSSIQADIELDTNRKRAKSIDLSQSVIGG